MFCFSSLLSSFNKLHSISDWLVNATTEDYRNLSRNETRWYFSKSKNKPRFIYMIIVIIVVSVGRPVWKVKANIPPISIPREKSY